VCDIASKEATSQQRLPSSRQACCKYTGGGIVLQNGRVPQPIASFHAHFFNAVCQFISTVKALFACAGNVGIKNFWPFALTSQRCTAPEMPPAQIGGANNT